MILSVLRLKSSPGQTTELVQALRSLARPARAAKGFICSRICFDADDASVIQYEERWATREDLNQQVRSSRYSDLLNLMETATVQPTLEFHFVSETRGLDYVATLRGETMDSQTQQNQWSVNHNTYETPNR